MKQTFLRPLRIVVSLLSLAALSFLFLDFSGIIPSEWYGYLTGLQFTPSFIRAINSIGHGLTLTAWGCIVVLLLTLLFGRVYCSYICPLGMMQDVVWWLKRKIRGKKKSRLRFAPPSSIVRYGILVITLLSLFFSGLYVVSLLDPYSNFGRFVSDLFGLLYKWLNNVLAAVLPYVFYPVNIVVADPYALVVPAVMLLLVLWFAIRRGRLYCNTICPVGTLLGIISYASLFKIRFRLDRCTQCGKCQRACKAQCLNMKQQTVDVSRCVGCADCISVCPNGGIRYSAIPTRKAKMIEPNRSKRRFLFGSLLFVGALSGISIRSSARSKATTATPKREGPDFRTATPPGSKALKRFTESCTACHLCVSACPTGVLQPSLFQYGFFGMMQPYMNYDASFCNYECTRCTEVCPSKALLPMTREEKITTQIGKVTFMIDRCIVHTEGTSCGSCSEHCPTKAVRMVPYMKNGVRQGELTIPQTDYTICIGCGACQYACPVQPLKAIMIDGSPVHGTALLPRDEAPEEKPLEDFPF